MCLNENGFKVHFYFAAFVSCLIGAALPARAQLSCSDNKRLDFIHCVRTYDGGRGAGVVRKKGCQYIFELPSCGAAGPSQDTNPPYSASIPENETIEVIAPHRDIVETGGSSVMSEDLYRERAAREAAEREAAASRERLLQLERQETDRIRVENERLRQELEARQQREAYEQRQNERMFQASSEADSYRSRLEGLRAEFDNSCEAAVLNARDWSAVV